MICFANTYYQDPVDCHLGSWAVPVRPRRIPRGGEAEPGIGRWGWRPRAALRSPLPPLRCPVASSGKGGVLIRPGRLRKRRRGRRSWGSLDTGWNGRGGCPCVRAARAPAKSAGAAESSAAFPLFLLLSLLGTRSLLGSAGVSSAPAH